MTRRVYGCGLRKLEEVTGSLKPATSNHEHYQD